MRILDCSSVVFTLFTLTQMIEAVPRRQDPRGTYCGHYPDDPSRGISSSILRKNAEIYRNEFGGGQGTLHPGYGGAPTMQAVCCDGWCLWVEKEYDTRTYSWDDSLFNDAVQRIEEKGIGTSHCDQWMRGTDIMLKFYPQDHQVWAKEGSQRPKTEKAIDWFGDTCRGARGWNGPH